MADGHLRDRYTFNYLSQRVKSTTLTRRGLQILRKDSGVPTPGSRELTAVDLAAKDTRTRQAEETGFLEGRDDWK